MMANPLSEVDNLVFAAIAQHASVAALVPASRIVVWDRIVDARELDAPGGDTVADIYIVPGRCDVRIDHTNAEAMFTRRYVIGFDSGRLMLSLLRDLELAVLKALRRLSDFQDAAGAPLSPALATNPNWRLQSVQFGETDPERLPAEQPHEWRDAIDLTLVITAPRSEL